MNPFLGNTFKFFIPFLLIQLGPSTKSFCQSISYHYLIGKWYVPNQNRGVDFLDSNTVKVNYSENNFSELCHYKIEIVEKIPVLRLEQFYLGRPQHYLLNIKIINEDEFTFKPVKFDSAGLLKSWLPKDKNETTLKREMTFSLITEAL